MSDLDPIFSPVCPECGADGRDHRKIRLLGEWKWRCGQCGDTRPANAGVSDQ